MVRNGFAFLLHDFVILYKKTRKYLTKNTVVVYNGMAVLQRGLVKWYDKGLQNL